MALNKLKNLKERAASLSASEDKILLREQDVSRREQMLLTQLKVKSPNADLNDLNQNLLREANQRLVISSIRAQEMAEAAELANAKISHMAQHDILTGLPNRTLMTDRLNQSIMQAKRYDKKIALVFLDIDHFKHINDSLGHEVGDKLLQSVANRLQTAIRLSDTVSRHGGDEFVILLNEVTGNEDTIQIAEKLSHAMLEPHQICGNSLRVTVSIGISIYPSDGEDANTMIRNADIAMYQAKKYGRNNYQLFSPDMNSRAVARLSIEQALHEAIQKHEFILYYQPKFNLKTGQITGAEALLRWQISEHELIMPVDFIDIAEDCGLILQIGHWVLHEACRQTQSWLLDGLILNQIAVNVSSKELHSKDFLERIRSVLLSTKLNPKYLEIELTETGLMQDIETTELLHAIKAMDVQIAVDDFGTGYSCLSYLRHFPIDTLKIDKSFVQDMNDGTGEAIIGAIIALGSGLNHRIVAEGIETQEQLSFLQSLNCTEGQGHFFSEALSAEEFAKLLVASN